MATEELMPKSAALREALGKAKGSETVDTLMLSVPEACERLRISKWTLYRLKREGKIKTVKIGSRRLIKASDIAEFIEQLQAESED